MELPPIENPLASVDLFERFDYGLAVGAMPLAGERFLLSLRCELGLRDLLNQACSIRTATPWGPHSSFWNPSTTFPGQATSKGAPARSP